METWNYRKKGKASEMLVSGKYERLSNVKIIIWLMRFKTFVDRRYLPITVQRMQD